MEKKARVERKSPVENMPKVEPDADTETVYPNHVLGILPDTEENEEDDNQDNQDTDDLGSNADKNESFKGLDSQPPSEYFKFHEAFIGWSLFYKGKEMSKPDAFHWCVDGEVRQELMRKNMDGWEFVKKGMERDEGE